jgi:hypothetical protein
MHVSPGQWQKLTPENIRAVPDSPGVLEIGNLVRTVVLIERGNGRLRERLQEIGPMPAVLPPSVGGHYFRFELARAEDVALARRLKTYRAQHRGSLPPGNLQADLRERAQRLKAA